MKLRNFINEKAAQGKFGDKARRDRKFILYHSMNVRAVLDKMNAENVFAFDIYFSGRLDL